MSASPWNFPDNLQTFWRKLIGDTRFDEARDSNTPIKATEVFKTYMIDGKQTQPSRPQAIEYMIRLVSQESGVFGEYECNVTKFREKLHPENGVEYVLSEDGPVDITYFYGATDFHNKLGYLYYKDGASDEDIMHAPRFIIIDDARPDHNIYGNEEPVAEWKNDFEGGMRPSFIIKEYEENGSNPPEYWWAAPYKYIVGTKHHLVYFGDKTEYQKGDTGSYTFPAGTHIVFFVIKNVGDDETKPWTRSYSLPRLNEIMNYKTNHMYGCNAPNISENYIKEEPNTDFVTYNWYGYTMMGIEDGTDHDVNDMMFFVNAKINTDNIIDMDDGEKPEPQSWLLAVEDLGNIGDFDFNDLVVKVSHIAGEKNVKVEPLAAGGTLPIRLFFNNEDNHIGNDRNFSHINQWFGNESWAAPINVDALNQKASIIEVPVDDDFSMSSSPLVIEGGRMGGFKVKVNHNPALHSWSQEVVEIAAPDKGSVPQMICLPGDWRWPKESVSILDAYPRIREWILDRNTNIDWYMYPQDGKTVSK